MRRNEIRCLPESEVSVKYLGKRGSTELDVYHIARDKEED
jgi:hypothetical protein